ncbi:unnamed protein product [Cyclocybe aegerita]|uniref:Cytochrome P450 n=1 Tax=Cyclocybe aegerita TaxID=1973307 RepID=A0A8S0VU73_CYCAE|nr:unnamed protein product [Cyclocybe aegerita]
MESLRSLLLCIFFLYLCWRTVKWIGFPLIFGTPFRDIPGPVSTSWAMGNLGQLFNAKGLPFHQSLVDMYGGMVKVYGFFGDEQLYVADPRALQQIIIKDQESFDETAAFLETNQVIFGPGLVATTGEQHRRQRRVVNPIFAVPQLRRISPVFYEIAEKLASVMESELQQHSSSKAVLDMSDWMSRVALESVGRTVLGYSFDPLDSPHNNPYTSAIKELIPTLFRLSLIRQFAPFLSKLGPAWFRRKVVEWTPHETVQKVKEMSDVMHETAQNILEQKRRELSSDPDNQNAKDIISILLKSNEDAKVKGGEQLSDMELTGQMTVLIFGAQDTTSSCLSRILHQISKHQEVQDCICEELRNASLEGSNTDEYGRLTYDALSNLPWLDAVLKETLRLYPPVPFVRRTAIKDTILPYSKLDSTSDEIAHVKVPKGTILFASIAGSNRLETIWGPDAKEWKPERWFGASVEVKDPARKLPGIYSGTLSFLGGGRSCVGYRFAQIEMKIILATLLTRFKFSCSENDPDVGWNLSQIISPSVRTTTAEGGVDEKKGLPLIVESLVQ